MPWLRDFLKAFREEYKLELASELHAKDRYEETEEKLEEISELELERLR